MNGGRVVGRVIRRHEPVGRGYYSGVVALIGRDEYGARTMDSSILIRTADLFGSRKRVGFYNTFAAYAGDDKVDCEGVGMVEVSRDLESGEVHALRGPRFASLQFHAESVLTRDGVRIMAERMKEVLGA